MAKVAEALGIDIDEGLTGTQVTERRALYGENTIGEEHPRPAWMVLVKQFTNAMVAVLIGAVVVTALIGDTEDAAVIGGIVVLNGLVGFVQEYRAEWAMGALRDIAGGRALVRRAGVVVDIPAADLVPGDVVVIGAGDIVPADLRVIESHALQIDEATLTGESGAVAKTSAALPGSDGSVLGELINMAFRGTSITHGRGLGTVVATGPGTELGRIADLLESRAGVPTPLERRLSRLARQMAAGAVAVCAVVFLIGVARREPIDTMFLTAVSLAVAAIPEGLPAVITVALALGSQRMARHNAIVRKLTAVETLGSVTVICTDKTGTLTENQMSVERVWTPRGEYRVEGVGYDPVGAIMPAPRASDDPDLSAMAIVATLCNDATLRAPATVDARWQMSGDPTEASLLTMAGRLGAEPASLRAKWPRIGEIPFDAERRRMSTVHRGPEGVLVATKGALEAVLPLVAQDEQANCTIAAKIGAGWASEGFRVLALADRHLEGATERPEIALHLVGLVALTDPPRPESGPAVAACRDAGIEPVMITGDHPATAASIATRIGMPIGEWGVVTGHQLDQLTDTELAERIEQLRVFARVSPAQKLRIVDAWHARGATVAMTGDGVNDAPALRRADIGVTMGRTGTGVSKEAADMVLADDNFATIVHAVEEGRRIYDNIRRTVRYLLTTNSGEVWIMLLAPVLGLPLPLVPVQILWVNLVTDSLPAIALGLQRAEPATMRRRPRARSESLFAGGLWQHALLIGVLMAALVLPMQAAARAADWHWQTMVFTTVAFLQLGHALAVRSEVHRSVRLSDAPNPWLYGAVAGTVGVQLAVVYVPSLHGLFHTASLRPVELAAVVAVSSVVYVAVEIEKWFRRRRRADI